MNCPMSCPISNKYGLSRQIFRHYPQYQIPRKSLQRNPRRYVRAYTIKLMDAFSAIYPNVPQKNIYLNVPVSFNITFLPYEY